MMKRYIFRYNRTWVSRMRRKKRRLGVRRRAQRAFPIIKLFTRVFYVAEHNKTLGRSYVKPLRILALISKRRRLLRRPAYSRRRHRHRRRRRRRRRLLERFIIHYRCKINLWFRRRRYGSLSYRSRVCCLAELVLLLRLGLHSVSANGFYRVEWS